MGKRERIGIIYEPSTNWIGGAYYVQNLVQSLNLCEDSNKPIIEVYTTSYVYFIEFKAITGYSYLRYHSTEYKSKIWNILRRVLKKVSGKKIDARKKIPSIFDKNAIIYPVVSFDNIRCYNKIVGWIPDFQERYLPEFFTEEDILARESICRTYASSKSPIIFSSKAAQDDFKKFYPDLKNTYTYVLPFAVFHPDFSKEQIESIKVKYGITKDYFFCANQFWMHKNHKFLFSAFKEARNRGLRLQLVCSGKLYDYRNPEYAEEIQSFISEYELENDILLLGFISRTEQLALMQNSYAIIQPSLFEGWSTVVEDAKCLNKFIFLSNLPVHREQAPMNVCYFDPHDENDLVQKMLKVRPTKHEYDYTSSQRKFGENFLNIVDKIKHIRTLK